MHAMKNLKIKNCLFVLIGALLMFSSCGPNPEEIANETCDCFESIIGDNLFSTADFKYHKDSCLNLIKAKYDTENDEKLRNELKLYDRQINSAVIKVENAYNAQAEMVATTIVNFCDETPTDWWISDNRIFKDSLNNKISDLYKAKITHPVIKNAFSSDIAASAINNLQERQLSDIIDTILRQYQAYENNNYYIDKVAVEWFTDSINDFVLSQYKVDKVELLDKALNSAQVRNSHKELLIKYNRQPISVLHIPYSLREWNKEPSSYKGTKMFLGERVIGYFYLKPDFKVDGRLIKGFAIDYKNNKPEIITYYMENTGLNNSYTDYKNFDKYKMSDWGKLYYSSYGEFEHSIFHVKCYSDEFDMGTLRQNIDKLVIVVGTVSDYDKGWLRGEPGYSTITLTDVEIVGFYDDFEITKNNKIATHDTINSFISREYFNYLKKNFDMNKNTTDTEEVKNTEEVKSKAGKKNCMKFLEDYEKFMVEYMAFIKKYIKNPTDTSLITDYTKMLQKASEWTEFDEECANDPAFIGKYTEIQMKIANAASEMYK